MAGGVRRQGAAGAANRNGCASAGGQRSADRMGGFKADPAGHSRRARGTGLPCQGPRPGTRWRLLWTLSEDDEKAAEAIRTKIKSKMNTAGALGAVIVGLTTFLLQNSLKKEPDCLAMAGVRSPGYVRGSVLRRLVPLRHPADAAPLLVKPVPVASPEQEQAPRDLDASSPRPSSVRRPPTSTARVLQASMVQVWVWIFTPATVLAGVGVACLALAATGDSAPGRPAPVAGTRCNRCAHSRDGDVGVWHRPNLGASD